MIKVLLVDDHQIILDAVTSFIEDESGIVKIGEALNGNEALKIIKNQKVDVVVLDLNMPVLDGIDTAEIIKNKYPKIKVLIFTMSTDIALIHKSIQAGVSGYLLKNEGKDRLISAIYSIYQGEEFFSKEIVKKLVLNIRKTKRRVNLTKREIEVLELIAKGLISKEIAKTLFISKSTVETHRRNLIEKTGVLNSQSLIKYAIDNKLIE